MKELAEFVKKMGPNGLGETLRALTFRGEGFGCYQNFEVRGDAKEWSEKDRRAFVEKTLNEGRFPDEIDSIVEAGRGYTFKECGLTIEVFWYWDGDGILTNSLLFRVLHGKEALAFIRNADCKKDYGWQRV